VYFALFLIELKIELKAKEKYNNFLGGIFSKIVQLCFKNTKNAAFDPKKLSHYILNWKINFGPKGSFPEK